MIQKITLEFQHESDAKLAMDAYKWYGVVFELDNWLRGEIKHGDHHEYQSVRDALSYLVNDRGITLHD